MSLLAGACLAAASCSDSDEDTKLPSPNFPEAVSATIEAGGTYTLEIEPNQNWEVSVPTATAAWFWIQDETQKVWTLRGSAGASRIVIGVAELDEFDDTRVCEVTLKMGGQSKVIATITTRNARTRLQPAHMQDRPVRRLRIRRQRNRPHLLL